MLLQSLPGQLQLAGGVPALNVSDKAVHLFAAEHITPSLSPQVSMVPDRLILGDLSHPASSPVPSSQQETMTPSRFLMPVCRLQLLNVMTYLFDTGALPVYCTLDFSDVATMHVQPGFVTLPLHTAIPRLS